MTIHKLCNDNIHVTIFVQRDDSYHTIFLYNFNKNILMTNYLTM